MKKLILLVFIMILAAAGYFALQKTNPPQPEQMVQTQSTKVNREQALEKIKNRPEVQDYLNRIPNGRVEVDNELDGEYNVHVYEIKDGHTATFNWYKVDKTTEK